MHLLRVAQTTIGLALSGLLVACAGSAQFSGEPPALSISPGGSDETTVSFLVEGSYEGHYIFTADANDASISATLSPSEADAVDGEPIEITVTVTVGASIAVTGGSIFVSATDDGGTSVAGTSVQVDIPLPP